jgi:enoyl-CoA hydratase/carnithine racemase
MMAMRALLGKVDIKALADWALSGRVFDVTEAQQRLLVTRVSADPEAEALELGRGLGRSSLRTVASIKAFLTSVYAQSAPMSCLAGELVAAAIAEQDTSSAAASQR